ncbi:response regulator [Geomonas propionica]|uniref:Response regulatory domain-containing protein n=1 Tax=Geomonas propionica TaxID=2798582 RepID=A0ABS0YLZ5_9BACT|nr:hypothetical protein [Geomonas propionica]MBJ6798545.1 hypothetical protein [Geomonas propionica]
MHKPIEHPSLKIDRVAVIDDDEKEIEIAVWQIEDAGLEPVVITGPFENIDDLMAKIMSSAQAALCDHRLNPYGYATFNGASLVARLYENKVPAILITQYNEMDTAVSIREWRRHIPVLLPRHQATSETIVKGFEKCLSELFGNIHLNRKPHRVLLRIDNLTQDGGENVIDAFLPGWDFQRAVRFPAALIQCEIEPKVGQYLFAKVNIGSVDPDELFFFDFEVAPEPEEDDGLA